MQNYTEIKNCRVCHSEKLEEVLDLNTQPLANNYHKGEHQEQFPLSINVCTECFHIQLSVVVDPDLMFKNYLYVSGTSRTLHEYFVDFVKICESFNPEGKKVLDIACNDGTQLDKFKDAGWETFGIDPAENLFSLSNKNHKVTCDYWNIKAAQRMNTVFDVITAQNVFAHTHHIHDFLESCAIVTNEKSHVFVQTSQADMIINNEFDTIYHEHLSFFNTKSMKKCANLNGFSLIEVIKTPIHGGSYVFVLKKGEHDETRSIAEIEKEAVAGLYSLETYTEYALRCKRVTADFATEVNKFKEKGYKTIGYGAAAKGNTFLNFAQVDLDYIVDDNNLKWDLLTPGRNIPIKDSQTLLEEDPNKIVIIPLAWNFFPEISRRANDITNSKLLFIKYFPEVKVL